jgi:hypothetical protein
MSPGEAPELLAKKAHKLPLEAFDSVRDFLMHKHHTVYPGIYGLDSKRTMSDPNNLKVLSPEKDLDVYKMIDVLQLQASLERTTEYGLTCYISLSLSPSLMVIKRWC